MLVHPLYTLFSSISFIVLGVIIIAMMYISYKRIKRLIRDLNVKENEIDNLKKSLADSKTLASNLTEQLKLKNIELAKQIKDGEDKTRVLSLLRNKLNEAEYNPKVNKKYWAELDRVLSIHLESNQSSFEFQIDDLHQEYIQHLHQQHPSLSVYDLRLCTYIKIGMNSKEIADMLRVLPSSINVSRSRLRKKLGLTTTQDLFSFLNEVEG